LESGRHEGISRSRVNEDLEVNPEEEEVEEEWYDNKSNNSVSEMSVEVSLSLDVLLKCEIWNSP